MARLTAMLRRRSGPYGVAWHTSCSAIEYLARHAPRGSDRALRLISLLRDRWHNLADPELINRSWPAIGPGREPAATIDLLAPDRPRAWWEAACGSRDFRMAVLPAARRNMSAPPILYDRWDGRLYVHLYKPRKLTSDDRLRRC